MDVFVERIIRLKRTPAVKMLQITIILFAVCLSMFFVMGLIGTSLAYLSVLVCVGFMYGAFKLVSLFNIEFEYSFTNGQLDVDKIVDARRRKRICAVDCREIKAFGRYEEAKHKDKTYGARITAGNPNASVLYYFVCNQPKSSNILVVFQPDEKMLEAMRPFVPRSVVEEGTFEKNKA